MRRSAGHYLFLTLAVVVFGTIAVGWAWGVVAHVLHY